MRGLPRYICPLHLLTHCIRAHTIGGISRGYKHSHQLWDKGERIRQYKYLTIYTDTENPYRYRNSLHLTVLSNWHCVHSVRSWVHVTVLCPSVCPSMGPQQQTQCCRFAVVGPAGRRYWSIVARPVVSSSGSWMRAVPVCELMGGQRGLSPPVLQLITPSPRNFCPHGVGATPLVARLSNYCSCLPFTV